ncbi:MAG: hypothetical protein AAF711_00800 [Planctomycetota bacterium]
MMMLLVACGCSDRIAEDLKNLSAASTSADERQAFDDLWHHSDTLAFTPRDAAGNQVSMTTDDWWDSVDYLELSVDGHSVRHALIEPDNLFYLMRE